MLIVYIEFTLPCQRLHLFPFASFDQSHPFQRICLCQSILTGCSVYNSLEENRFMAKTLLQRGIYLEI